MTELNEGPSIKRIDFDQNLAKYDQLRQQGIVLLQQMCGDTWTDHNTHDPGITLLEQLSYALTELLYDCNYDVADYLVDDDDSLDMKKLALHSPQQILSCRPTTLADIRKVLLDRLGNRGEIDNMWVNAMPGPLKGLYEVVLQLAQGATQDFAPQTQANQLTNQVLEQAVQLRNLGEDIGRVSVVENLPCKLSCRLDVFDDHDIDTVIAQVYFMTELWLEQPGSEEDEPSEQKETAVEDVFDGPRLRHARYQEVDEEAGEWLSLSYLRKQLSGIAGVKRVLRVDLFRDDKPLPPSCKREPGFMLQLPQTQEQLDRAITLARFNDSRIDYPRVYGHYLQLKSNYAPVLIDRQQIELHYPQPQGHYRELDKYYPLRHLFPNLYGLNEQTMNKESDTDERTVHKAKINQFKGYLSLFDQLMAHFKANLSYIKTLFSIDIGPDSSADSEAVQSYGWAKPIDQFSDDPGYQTLQPIHGVEQFDLSIERKNRLLDHMLALYGECFDQQLVQRFSSGQSPKVLQLQLLLNKTHYLKHVVLMTQARGGGVDYLQPVQLQPITFGFGQKLAAYLGMGLGYNGEPQSQAPSIGDKQGKHCCHHCHCCCNQSNNNHCCCCCKEKPEPEPIPEPRHFDEYIQVVEHLLLRSGQESAADLDFFQLQISVVLPAWTTRCSDPLFRQGAMQLIEQLCPAHLQPHVYWLDIDQMKHFENALWTWQNQLQRQPYQEVSTKPFKPKAHGALAQSAIELKTLLQSFKPYEDVIVDPPRLQK